MSHAQCMRLFLQHERELLRHVMVPNINDARDVLQETAVALWQSIAHYDPARPFVAWARGIALNKAKMFNRFCGDSLRCPRVGG